MRKGNFSATLDREATERAHVNVVAAANPQAEMRAFDKLPEPVRRFLDEEAFLEASAITALEFIQGNPDVPVEEVVAMMREANEAAKRELAIVKR